MTFNPTNNFDIKGHRNCLMSFRNEGKTLSHTIICYWRFIAHLAKQNKVKWVVTKNGGKKTREKILVEGNEQKCQLLGVTIGFNRGTKSKKYLRRGQCYITYIVTFDFSETLYKEQIKNTVLKTWTSAHIYLITLDIIISRERKISEGLNVQ